VGELEHGGRTETVAGARQRELQGGRDEVLAAASPFIERLRGPCCRSRCRPVEPEHVDPRCTQTGASRPRRAMPRNSPVELGTVRCGGGRVPARTLMCELTAVGAPEVVPGPVAPPPTKRPRSRRIGDPRQGHPVRSPIARTAERRRIPRRLVVCPRPPTSRSRHEPVVPRSLVELRVPPRATNRSSSSSPPPRSRGSRGRPPDRPRGTMSRSSPPCR